MKGSLVISSAICIILSASVCPASSVHTSTATKRDASYSPDLPAVNHPSLLNNLHADDSKISRIRPLAYPTAASPETMLSNRHNHINYHSAKSSKLHGPIAQKQPRHSTDGKKLTNQEVLRTLGLSKMNIPSSHHRKRLAVESRHHSRPDDSHMYIIKLPPNPVYYTKNGPIGGLERNAIGDSSKKVSVNFQSNGKPGRIYHWNLPVLQKMLEKEGAGRAAPNSRVSNDIADLIDIRHIPTWSKPWENETGPKAYRTNDRNGAINDDDDAFKARKSPSYYAPRPKKSTKTHKLPMAQAAAGHESNKYFPGNGKPQGFYVIKGKSQKPYYRKLIP